MMKKAVEVGVRSVSPNHLNKVLRDMVRKPWPGFQAR